VRIEPVDAADDTAFAAWYSAFAGGLKADRDDPPVWEERELRVAHRRQSGHLRRLAYAAVDGDGTVLGGSGIDLPQRDNRSLLMFTIAVPPPHRRRGVGSALFAHVEEVARAEGRSSLLTQFDLPVGVDREDFPAAVFATKRGLTCRNVDFRRVLDLPMPSDLTARLRAAADGSGDYRLVSWSGPCPEEYADQYAHLKSRLSTDAPIGDMEVEPEHWDVDRLRDEEARVAEQRRTLYVTVAVASDGTLAAHTVLVVPSLRPELAFQWDTLVLRDHRGHRLGLALKLANLEAMTAGEPRVRRVTTWNAQQNGPMVAVNDAMGHRVVERHEEWQRSD